MQQMMGLMMVGALFVGSLPAPTARAQCDPQQVAKLLASDGAAQDYFGWSVSISGDTAIAGADGDDDRGDASGSAYVFVLDATGWWECAKLTALDGAPVDHFGASVSISGDTAIVGAPGDRDSGGWSGSAYIFVRDGTSWTQQAKLTALDGAEGDFLGGSVCINGDTAIIGAHTDDDLGTDSGSAYVFVRDGTSWTQQAKLTAFDGAEGDRFGYPVSVSGDTALVGAGGDDGGSGSAYVFVRDGTSWIHQARLAASDGAEGDEFGSAVSLSGDTALVGAWLDDDLGADSGSAYVFVRDGTDWTQQAKLNATDGAEGDAFGSSVALSGDNAVVGAIWDADNGSESGSAYVFVRDGTSWTQQPKLTASDGAEGDRFGCSVALSGGTALVGAGSDDDYAMDCGAAYVFDLNCDCPPDINGDGVADSRDFIIFLNAFVAGDPLADWNGDGSVNSQDFIAFLNAFVRGC